MASLRCGDLMVRSIWSEHSAAQMKTLPFCEMWRIALWVAVAKLSTEVQIILKELKLGQLEIYTSWPHEIQG
jgi:hypothetical protein